jgi:Tfp pilus assembly protein PilE
VRRNNRGFTLIELLVIVNIVAILFGVASAYYVEFGDEARYTEIYGVFPQIIRSQAFYALQYNGYYTALNRDELKTHGVDVSDVYHFTYSTFPNDASSFSVRADATDWAFGGWVLFNMKETPQWSSDGTVIRREWLPE